MAAYKLRCTLMGHSMDVRAVAATSDGAIITGSRDRTAKVWLPNKDNNGFVEILTAQNHTNFVSCVCILPPDDSHPTGIILTGSNDNTISAFTQESSKPLYKLVGHSNTVCALVAGKFGTVLSGSWDETAKVWLGSKCLMNLEGHTAAVWAVAIVTEQGLMLTASADKTIKMWKAGRCEHTFTGHADCVRGLAVLGATQFLSCSNDATIRHWLITGECTQVLYGHSNFVYGMDILPNSQNFVSCGEDRTIRIWKNFNCEQTIRMPAQSIWCVACLPNGDVVAGSSDGTVRIFTAHPQLHASNEELQAFENEVASTTLNTGDIGDLKVSDLPGREALFETGKKDGQTRMIREGGNVALYNWNASELRWVKVGDVVGASGSSESTSGKVLYEGKEYDYVFNVDVDDKSTLKLPYNINEDPWLVAHNFLERHNLSPMLLDQVANHIITNTKGMTLGEAPTQISDPFTGGSRYVPSTRSQMSTTQTPRQGPSPEIQQVPGDSKQVRPSSVEKFFPQLTYLSFDSSNPSAILAKLKEFNAKTGDGEHKMDDVMFEEVCKLLDPENECTALQISTLEKLLQWPHDILFPALDVLRLSIKVDKVNNHFCSDHTSQQFLAYLLDLLSPESLPANQMLSLRTLCNMVSQPLGEQIFLANRDNIISRSLNLLPTNNKNVQIALCTLFLNISVALSRKYDLEGKSQCISALSMLSDSITDGEAHFRLLVSLGTLVFNDRDGLDLAKSMEFATYVEHMKKFKDPPKVAACAAALEVLFTD